MPHGVFRGIVLNADRPFQFVSAPGLFVQLDEHNHDYRVVTIDGRAHSEDPDPKFNGESVAHWEGDTLVIDTIAVDERVWNGEQWQFHSDQERVIERITRPSMNYLTLSGHHRRSGKRTDDKAVDLRAAPLLARP